MRSRLLLLALCLFAGTCCVTTPKVKGVTPAFPTNPRSLMSVEPSHVDAKPVTPAKHLVARLTFSADVTEESVDAAIKFLNDAQAQDGLEAIVIEWNTDGGSVLDGFRLAKEIEKAKVPVICVVDGAAQSEGFYLLQSCTERYMTRRSLLMAHEPYFILRANTPLDRTTMTRLLDQTRVTVATWTEYAGRRLKISLKEFRRHIMWSDWNMLWEEALKIGAIDGTVSSADDVVKDVGETLKVTKLK